MIPAERRKAMLKLLADRGGVLSIHELGQQLGVSHMTVRRDARVLEQSQLVYSVTGGIQLTEKLHTEPSHDAKEVMAAEDKNRIGMAAAQMIPEHACVYLDAGTTSLALANYLSHRDDLTVVTNDFEVLRYLTDNTSSRLIHIGGEVNKRNRSSVGLLATKILEMVSLDIAFMSASSWDQHGVTTPDIDKVSVKRAALGAARKKILICDATKYGKVATYVAFRLTELDTVVTDRGLPSSAQKFINLLDVEIVVV